MSTIYAVVCIELKPEVKSDRRKTAKAVVEEALGEGVWIAQIPKVLALLAQERFEKR